MTTTDWRGCRLRDRLRNLDALGVLDDLHFRGVDQQEGDHHRQDVDQRDQVQLGIGAVPRSDAAPCGGHGSTCS